MIPTSGSLASSSSSSVSGIVVTVDSPSRSEAWIGSRPSRTPAESAGGRETAQTVDDELPRLVRVAAAGRPGEAEDTVGLVTGEAVHRLAQRADADVDVLRPRDDGVREDRGDGGDTVRRVEAAPAQGSEVGVVVLSELRLPDPDPVEPGRGVGPQVLAVARSDGRDLAQREHHDRPGTLASSRRPSGGLVSCFATR